jgi:hypothetical protein
VLTAWLGLGVIVIGLLNVAKFLVRSSNRRTPHTIDAIAKTGPMSRPVDGSDLADMGGGAFGYGPPSQPGASALRPPIARRSA